MATIPAKDTTANPAPLGLFGFGMTTVLLNIHNAGFYELNSMILAMGVFFGGLGQVIVGILEWKKGNTFGMTAFGAYGLFWLTLVGVWAFPGLGGSAATSAGALAAYLFFWGLFTLALFFGTLRMNLAIQVVFGSLVVLFWLLALGKITGSVAVTRIAGWEGLLCGLSAMYLGAAQVLNEVFKKEVLPICPVKN
jgi:succinate-acetate transporter protein